MYCNKGDLSKKEKSRKKYLSYLKRTLYSLRDEIGWIEYRIKYVERGGDISDSDDDTDDTLEGAKAYNIDSE